MRTANVEILQQQSSRIERRRLHYSSDLRGDRDGWNHIDENDYRRAYDLHNLLESAGFHVETTNNAYGMTLCNGEWT